MTRRMQRRLFVDSLESRRVLAAPACVVPSCLDVALVEELDQFGQQIVTVQAYQDAVETRSTLAIYDTGASVVSFSATDQLLLDLVGFAIPVKVAGGATADAVGGTLNGDVSEPGGILVDGLHALDFGADLAIAVDLSGATEVAGVQTFIGTESGSPLLPSITGTPIHNPSATHPGGVAAQIDFDAFELDFGELFPELPEFEGIVVALPDLEFVAPGTQLTVVTDGSVSQPVRVPLGLIGTSNHQNPRDMVTTSPNPVQTSVSLYDDTFEQHDQTLLFDTGAQLTVISSQLAADLGLDLTQPERTVEVAGAGGGLQLPGFTLDVLDLPRDDDGDGAIDGILRFSNVPVYVLDTVPGLDGILGTNLFNTASELIYDPFDPAGPSLQVSFLVTGNRQAPDPQAVAGVNLVAATYPALAGGAGGHAAPGFRFDAGPGWQNPVDRFDVDNDSAVAPSDVLRLFNLLNSKGSHTLSDPPLRETNKFVFYDVNGDGHAAPSDALLVINRLNSLPSHGEGESVADSTDASSSDMIIASRRTLFAAPPFVDSGYVDSVFASAGSSETPTLVDRPKTLVTPRPRAASSETNSPYVSDRRDRDVESDLWRDLDTWLVVHRTAEN